MLDQQIDGVSLDAASARRTLQRIRQLADQMPLVYLPSHDPESAMRLEQQTSAIDQPNARTAGVPSAAFAS